jgi:hypothetical protein
MNTQPLSRFAIVADTPSGASARTGWTPGPAASLALALAVTALPVAAHLAGQAIGLAACVALALIVTVFAAPAVLTALIFAYLFQNLVVAVLSPHIASLDQFNAIRAYNFVFTAVAWIAVVTPYWSARGSFAPALRRLMDVSTAALVLIGIYFVIGFPANPESAAVYLRNIATPFLLFQIFVLIAYRQRVSLAVALVLIAVACLLYGYLELLDHNHLFAAINGDTYLHWRTRKDHEAGVYLKEMYETGRVMRSEMDALVVDFLNTPLTRDLGLQFYRLVGPNFHSISYAYVLAFFCVMLFALGHRWYALLALPVLLVVGSKGALVFTVLTIAATALLTRLRGFAPLWIFLALLVAYAAAGIVAGIRTGDYHVIGFLGGLKGFFANPIGRGIGVGGNLSIDMATRLDWSRSQSLGHTDVAVESAVGVLLYQMGVFGAVVLAVFAWIAVRLWRLYLVTGNRACAAVAFSVLVVVINGIFQEEALFAPLAMGLVLAMAGLLLGRGCRPPDRPGLHDRYAAHG